MTMNILDVEIVKVATVTEAGKRYGNQRLLLDQIVGSPPRLGELAQSAWQARSRLGKDPLTGREGASHEASNFRIVNDAVVCDIKVLATPQGEALTGCLDGVKFTVRGRTATQSNGEVLQYEFLALDATDHSV